ncbi:flagellar basal body P-ring protein FlgI [Anaeromyxobacter dehalogenans]|uniref:Flagellar P-ring protein n=1 Tax=Anaeromyxobacter dehalogenans (strain 2CP-C) TaxID=290397 RepID=FLGI_ANADE|nr:flagellar basal body P-ring protein FlgI [Anaeromyxobacter dehalogenans]Q2IQP1.1 RecName: Full=Flagellar P-ring protein; AltName: Full=Basal body P-ring protein; Flags: Precursor [Anaeromyxobacter dehalogenans 2CP-C]ABC81122.1 flagellar P-ring protein [Anaeromyxobacter dehalogenans 2CP-C]
MPARPTPPAVPLALALAAALAAPAPAAAARVKELADVVGVRENALYGYGLVVGLAGTGDSERVLFTQQSVAGMLGRLGIRIDPKDVRSRNVAAVMVTARLPPFARPGTRIDVAVASMGNARSLAGGLLLVTPLSGGDGKVYAVGQGPVQVAGYDAGAGGAELRKNTPTSGRVAGGATVERAVDFALGQAPLVLALRRPDLTTASRVAAAVNAKLGAGTARAVDPAAVELSPPPARKDDAVGFLAEVELLEVEADQRARVVVSERTGTVVAGDGVRLRPVAVAHGGLQVRVQRDPAVSQPAPFGAGRTVEATRDRAAAAEGAGGVVALPAAASVKDLARALDLLGATPRDLVAVLEAIRAAGALDADLEVLE